MPKKAYKCKRCKKITMRYRSSVRNPHSVFCSRECTNKYQIGRLAGKANPNYKHGKWVKSYCTCGNPKDCRAKQCAICAKRSFTKKGAKDPRVGKRSIMKAVKQSKSYDQTAKLLGVERVWVTKRIKKFKIDVSHFRPGRSRPIPLNKLFSVSKIKRHSTIRNALIKHNLKPYVCGICGQKPKWKGKELVLELDHINGNAYDNRIGNLRFLCPNCHTQTKTNKGKNCYGTKKKRR
jgi:hypothetical protein